MTRRRVRLLFPSPNMTTAAEVITLAAVNTPPAVSRLECPPMLPSSTPVRTPVRPDDTPPRRIRRSRAKGWTRPHGAIYVGRPSRWGNPWRSGQDHPWYEQGGVLMTAQEAVEFYGRHIRQQAWDLTPLRGHDLVCWCPLDAPCHADVLLALANEVAQ